MRTVLVFSAGALLLLAQSCSTSKATTGAVSMTSEQAHEAVRANQVRIQTVRGEGTISFETPSLAQSGSFVLTWKRPDSLLVNLRGPFGIKVGSAMLTRTNFQFYNSLENRLYTGETTSKNLSRVLRVNLDFDDLMNLFTGGIFLNSDLGNPDETGIEDDQFTLMYRTSTGAHKYYVDGQTRQITKIDYLDTEGKLEFEQRFINFQSVDSTFVPFNIRIVQPKERRMISVVYSDLSLNDQDLQFTFSYPRNAQQVRWQ